MGHLLLVRVFILLFLNVSVLAVEITSSRNARTIESYHSSLVTKSVAHACLSMTLIPDSIPCAASMSVKNAKSYLGVNGLISNGYDNYQKISSILDGEVDQEFVDVIFGDTKTLQFEANTELYFRSRYLNASFSPYQVSYFSVVRNEANPDVGLHASKDEGFVFQGAYAFWDERLSLGVQFRTITSEYIHQQFKLLDLATEEGKKQLQPLKITRTYLEPSATYFSKTDWQWRLTAVMANALVSGERDADIHPKVHPELSVGLTPYDGWGSLEVSLDYRNFLVSEENSDKFHLGIIYNFAAMYLSSGFDKAGSSLGLFYKVEQINAGVLYTTTQFPQGSSDNYAQTVYVQFGCQL